MRYARYLTWIVSSSLLSVTAFSAQAEVYKFVDANGVVNYTNIKPAGRSYKTLDIRCPGCKSVSAARGVNWHNTPLYLDEYAAEIEDATRRHGVNEALVRAVIHAESHFKPSATSRMGAAGLMQLMPATATRFGVREIYDVTENIEGGVAYLRFLNDKFGADLDRVAAGYNAGENAVMRHDGIPPYQETRTYVERVRILEKRYRTELTRRAVNQRFGRTAAVGATISG